MKEQLVGSTKRSGSFGGMTAVTVSDVTILKSKIPKRGPRAAMTYNQRYAQARYASCMSAYHVLGPLVRKTMVPTKPMQRCNGLFLKYNMDSQWAVMTRQEGEQGGSLLCEYTVSCGDGQLEPIALEVHEECTLTSVELGGLELTEETSLLEFSNAVVSSNKDFQFGDALTFVVCTQALPVGHTPAKFEMLKSTLVLYPYDDSKGRLPVLQLLEPGMLRSCAVADTSVIALPAGPLMMVALIQSRREKDGRVNSSEQRLTGSNPYLGFKLTDEERDRAAASFGRIKKGSCYTPNRPLPPPVDGGLEDYFK